MRHHDNIRTRLQSSGIELWCFESDNYLSLKSVKTKYSFTQEIRAIDYTYLGVPRESLEELLVLIRASIILGLPDDSFSSLHPHGFFLDEYVNDLRFWDEKISVFLNTTTSSKFTLS